MQRFNWSVFFKYDTKSYAYICVYTLISMNSRSTSKIRCWRVGSSMKSRVAIEGPLPPTKKNSTIIWHMRQTSCLKPDGQWELRLILNLGLVVACKRKVL
jgi:hypothetical protein